MRRIGIFAGAFDPIHKGHVSIMQNALSKSKVDEILLVPGGGQPYRTPIASPQQQREMIGLALRDVPHVRIADEGLLKPGQNAIDTVRAIMRAYAGAEFTYIIGADKLAGLLHWPKAGRLFELCDLLIYPRAGYNAQELTLFALARGVRAQMLAVQPVNMSSSLVRTQIALLSDAREMILPEVARYIAQRGLYHPPYEAQLRPQMNPRRFAHTLGVRDLAVELAWHHHLPMQKAAVAALVHDCAKCMKLSQLQAIAHQYRLSENPEVLKSNALLHGKAGAVLAAVKYHIHDEDVLNAIRYHTTGRAHMSPLELCIYVADAAEAGRSDYPGLAGIRRLMWDSLPQAALVSMEGTRAYVASSGQGYSLDTEAAIRDLTRRTQQHQSA